MGGLGTVRDVFERLRTDRAIVFTTVLSTMKFSIARGTYIRSVSARRCYRSHRISHSEHNAGLMRETLSEGKDDNTAAVLTHFGAAMTPEELAEL